MGGTEKRGGETKILKRGRQAGPRHGCLKGEGRGRGWNPLTNYECVSEDNFIKVVKNVASIKATAGKIPVNVLESVKFAFLI